MLGETRAPAPAAPRRRASSCACPGTNPFFPTPHDHQGNRFLELMGDHQLEVYLMNTGRVGGPDDDEGSKKVRIKHSSAIVKAIAEGTIEWERDPDFGYHVASAVPGIDEIDATSCSRGSSTSSTAAPTSTARSSSASRASAPSTSAATQPQRRDRRGGFVAPA